MPFWRALPLDLAPTSLAEFLCWPLLPGFVWVTEAARYLVTMASCALANMPCPASVGRELPAVLASWPLLAFLKPPALGSEPWFSRFSLGSLTKSLNHLVYLSPLISVHLSRPGKPFGSTARSLPLQSVFNPGHLPALNVHRHL